MRGRVGIRGGIVNFAWGFRRNVAMDEVFSLYIFIFFKKKKPTDSNPIQGPRGVEGLWFIINDSDF